MRSGTHLLMATLAANFELGDLSIEAAVPGQRWSATGEDRAVVPWRFEAPGTLEEFLTPERIGYWYRHTSEYCAHVRRIRFEDLTGKGFDGVMAGIAKRFRLRLRAPGNEPFWRVDRPVGWSSGPGEQGRWRDWPREWQARFASVIPPGFLGYELPARPSR